MKSTISSVLSLALVMGVFLLAPAPAEAATFTCEDGASCADTTITPPAGENSVINCNGVLACENLGVVLEDIHVGVSINCNTLQSCSGMSVSVSSLASSFTTSGFLSVTCQDSEACANAYIKVPSGSVFSLQCVEPIAPPPPPPGDPGGPGLPGDPGLPGLFTNICAGVTVDSEDHRLSSTDSDVASDVDVACTPGQCDLMEVITQPEQSGFVDVDLGFSVVPASAALTCSDCPDFTQQDPQFCPLGYAYIGSDGSGNETTPSRPVCDPADPGTYMFAYSTSGFSPPPVFCPIGTYQDEYGQSFCDIAPPGTYAPTTGLANAFLCAVGTYQPDEGQGSCLDAPAGSFVNSPGSANALLCAVGTYQDETGQASCKPSPADSYVDTVGAITFTACPVGTVSPEGSDELADCVEPPPAFCDPGFYSVLGVCVAADPGNYVAEAGALEQTACAVGTYQPDAGQASCLASPAGSFVSETGSVAATLCAAGSFQGLTGQASCNLAPAGSYVPTAGATEALACPAGTTSEAGATACTPIPPTGGGTVTVASADDLDRGTEKSYSRKAHSWRHKADRVEDRVARLLAKADELDAEGKTEEAARKRAQAADDQAQAAIYLALAQTVDTALAGGGSVSVNQQPGLFPHTAIALKAFAWGMDKHAGNLLRKAERNDDKAAKYEAKGKNRQAAKAREEAAADRAEAALLLALVEVIQLSLP